MSQEGLRACRDMVKLYELLKGLEETIERLREKFHPDEFQQTSLFIQESIKNTIDALLVVGKAYSAPTTQIILDNSNLENTY